MLLEASLLSFDLYKEDINSEVALFLPSLRFNEMTLPTLVEVSSESLSDSSELKSESLSTEELLLTAVELLLIVDEEFLFASSFFKNFSKELVEASPFENFVLIILSHSPILASSVLFLIIRSSFLPYFK